MSLLFYFSCSNQQNKEEIRMYECIRYDNGNIKELGLKVDSLEQGLWITFYPNGQIEFISYYKDGKEEGPQEIYHENGQLRLHVEFHNGKNHGKAVSYKENGKLKNEAYFVNGLIDSIRKELIDDDFYNIHEYDMGKFVRTIAGEDPTYIDELEKAEK